MFLPHCVKVCFGPVATPPPHLFALGGSEECSLERDVSHECGCLMHRVLVPIVCMYLLCLPILPMESSRGSQAAVLLVYLPLPNKADIALVALCHR